MVKACPKKSKLTNNAQIWSGHVKENALCICVCACKAKQMFVLFSFGKGYHQHGAAEQKHHYKVGASPAERIFLQHTAIPFIEGRDTKRERKGNKENEKGNSGTMV